MINLQNSGVWLVPNRCPGSRKPALTCLVDWLGFLAKPCWPPPSLEPGQLGTRRVLIFHKPDLASARITSLLLVPEMPHLASLLVTSSAASLSTMPSWRAPLDHPLPCTVAWLGCGVEGALGWTCQAAKVVIRAAQVTRPHRDFVVPPCHRWLHRTTTVCHYQ